MSIKKIIAAQSPVTLTENDFSESLNIPYCLLIASGGGNIVVNLPTINSIRQIGKVIAICEDATTQITINSNAADSITENSNITSSISVNGNKNFVVLEAITYTTGNIWLGLTNGGSGGNITSITYAELVSSINANSLIAGNYYLITDFQMATYIQFSGSGIGDEDIYIGAIEPMVAQAISSNELSCQIKSTLLANDIITWRWNFVDREWDAVAGQSTGIITSRYDTINKLYRDYDWRNVVFRRWLTPTGFNFIFPISSSYQDFPPFNLNVLCFDNRIGSPISNNPIFGQYSLDNFVFQGIANNNQIDLGYAVTITNKAENNKIGYYAIEYYNEEIKNNTIKGISQNWCKQINNNICESISQNDMRKEGGAIGNIENNNVTEISNNSQMLSISDNVGFTIYDNFGGTIIGNSVSRIYSNQDCLEITNNNGREIYLNLKCTIRNNNVNSIKGNNIGFSQNNSCNIIENTGQVIQNNISSNFDLSIIGNSIGEIKNNEFNEIAPYEMTNNIGSSISDNFFQFSRFTGNKFGLIQNSFIGSDVKNNIFVANWDNEILTSNPDLSSTNPSITTWDETLGNVIQKLNNGILSYIQVV